MKHLANIDQQQALDIFHKVNFFNNFTDQEKDILTRFRSHFIFAESGDSIISEGGFDDSCYILLSGKVSVLKKSAARPLSNLHPGHCFGEIAFLTRRRRTTSILAVSNCIVFELDQPTLQQLDRDIREKLKDNLTRILVTRLDHMNELVAKLSARLP